MTSAREHLEAYVAGGKVMQVSSFSLEEPTFAHVWYLADMRRDVPFFMSHQARAHSASIRAGSALAGGILTIELEALGQKVSGVTFVGEARECSPDDDHDDVRSFCGRWPKAAESLTPELLRARETPMRLYSVAVTRWVLFDETHFPDQPRQELHVPRKGH